MNNFKLWIARDKFQRVLSVFNEKPILKDNEYWDRPNTWSQKMKIAGGAYYYPEVTFENSPQQLEVKSVKDNKKHNAEDFKLWIARAKDKFGLLTIFTEKPITKDNKYWNKSEFFSQKMDIVESPYYYPEVTFENSPQRLGTLNSTEETFDTEEPQVYKTEDGVIITYSEREGYKFIE